MTADLKILADNRDALLLAEIGAWLHDMGKCTDEFLNNENRRDKCNGESIDPYKAILRSEDLKNYTLSDKFKNIRMGETEHQYALNKILGQEIVNKLNKKFELYSFSYYVHEIIYFGRPFLIGKTNKAIQKNIEPIEYLGRAHGAAHIEKEGGEDLIDQKANDVRLSSPFGYETESLVGLTDKLKSLPFDDLTKRQEFLRRLNKIFENAPGDTQRPINEIDLWDWSSIVATLYKSALSGSLLGNKPQPNDLKWRLLAIRVNSEEVWGNASNMPVLIARKNWLMYGLNKVKELLEETYPLGNEVYRDENGSIFVVPNIDKLLEVRESEKNRTLQELISVSLDYNGEIIVAPVISRSWCGQNPRGRPDPARDEIPPIGDILLKMPYSPADASIVKKWWDEAATNPEICTISWLRPQEQKGKLRKASDYWAEKVRGRAEDWKNNLDKTIWIDEVADFNGRICLIVGKIDISDWLKPDGYVNTLLVKPPDKGVNQTSKTPSFARIRRVWETSKTFWEEEENKLNDSIRAASQRICLNANYEAKSNITKGLIINSAYATELDGIHFSIFYAKENEFLIIENLQRLAKLMGAEEAYLNDYSTAAAYVQNRLFNEGKLKLYESEGIGAQNKQIGEITLKKVETENTSYIPVIPILAEPSIFMAIVPADKVLDVAKSIKDKYESEMNKVRNRLPITIGLVFAKSHTPLSSIIEAGKRMLNGITEKKDITWKIESNIPDPVHPNWNELTLKKNEHQIKVKVNAVMGDNRTPDVWYPYWLVESDINGKTPSGRTRQFIGHDKKDWVHVCDLQQGDNVKFTSSRLDFEFLDSAARRFEISYKDGKRRDNKKCNRPYYLEELADFEKLWNILKNRLARTQIKGMLGLIETKREEWKAEPDNETFKDFVHNVIHNTNWKNGKPIEIDEIENAAVSGKLSDIVELYMDILKDKEEIESEESK